MPRAGVGGAGLVQVGTVRARAGKNIEERNLDLPPDV